MDYYFTQYPFALRAFILCLILVNLLCWAEAMNLIHAARLLCCAHTVSFLQSLLQRLLTPFILLTSQAPAFLCAGLPPIAFFLLWAGALKAAALVALAPLAAFLLHLLIVAVSCLLMGWTE